MQDSNVPAPTVGRMERKGADGYEHSFGMLGNESVYSDPMNKFDMRPELKAMLDRGMASLQTKAMGVTTGGAGTAGYAMVPIYVDSRIVDQTRKYTPLVELIRRVTNMGTYADYNFISAKASAVVAGESPTATTQDDTPDRASTAMKYLYAFGEVTGQAQAAYPSYILEGFQSTGSGLSGTSFSPLSAPNAKQLVVLLRARALREFEEDLIVNGDTDDDSNEFNGIVDLMSTTNTVDLNTSAIAYGDTETAIRYAFDDGGRPNLGVCSSSVMTDLRKAMIDTFRYRPADMTGANLPFGISSHLVLETMVGPAPVIPSMNLSNTTGSKAIYFLDMSVWEMRVLQDMVYQELAKTTDTEKFMLKIYEALICKSTGFNASVTEIE